MTIIFEGTVHTLPHLNYSVDLVAFKSPPIQNVLTWFPCVQVSLVLTYACE